MNTPIKSAMNTLKSEMNAPKIGNEYTKNKHSIHKICNRYTKIQKIDFYASEKSQSIENFQ